MGLVKDGLIGLGFLTVMSFVLSVLFIATSPRGHRKHLVHCTLCEYASTEARVLEHEKLDHPAA
jgi:hypothetical protein